ncbi:hypothetical protein JCM11641_008281 [Rhodosporidiobolus odoratus]
MQRISTLSTTLRAAFIVPGPSPRYFSSSPLTSSSVATQTSATPASPVDAAPVEPQAVASPSAPKYYVPRSRFGELPVYSDVKNAGTKYLTVIRRAEGDVEALRRDLSAFLSPSSSPSNATSFWTKPQARQVIIKGDWVRETKEWLAAKGF